MLLERALDGAPCEEWAELPEPAADAGPLAEAWGILSRSKARLDDPLRPEAVVAYLDAAGIRDPSTRVEVLDALTWVDDGLRRLAREAESE